MKGEDAQQRAQIQAALGGSVAAFERLVLAHESKVVALIASYSRYPDEVEDIYQEALIKAYRALKTFKGESQFHTWLYRICINVAKDHHRKPSNIFSRHLNPQEHAQQSSQEPLHPHALQYKEKASRDLSLLATESAYVAEAYRKALRQLSENERLAFVFCHQNEHSIAETATIMNCSTGSIKTYLYRARAKLSKIMHEYKDEQASGT